MNRTRRGFLGALAGAMAAPIVGAAVLDPERAPWVPGKKLISIPKPNLKAWANIDLSDVESVTISETWVKKPDGYHFHHADPPLLHPHAQVDRPVLQFHPMAFQFSWPQPPQVRIQNPDGTTKFVPIKPRSLNVNQHPQQSRATVEPVL